MRDTGIGIPADALPRVFDMFPPVDRSVERSTGGLGIGLALAKGLVEMHGGNVTAASEGPGRGSTFTVRLPVPDARPESAPAAPSDDQRPAAHGRRILVVDDNRDAAESPAEVLRRAGHEARVAYDGLGAVEAAGQFRPDVVLLDIGLPKLNGHDVARRVRGRPWGRGMVLVAVTGWGQDEDRRRAREAGFDHHLTKPVDPAALDRMLAALSPSG